MSKPQTGPAATVWDRVLCAIDQTPASIHAARTAARLMPAAASLTLCTVVHGEALGAEVSLEPVLVVDGDTVLATPAQLAGASVTAKVVGSELGPKINAMTYKSKSNQRRRWGHRQHYATLEITAITAAG